VNADSLRRAAMATGHILEFGPFQLDATERILVRNGKPIPLAPKVFDTLLVLVQNSGHTVQKDELMKQVWPDSFVEENNLNKNISALRKALGDVAGMPCFIQTVAKRGYRFVPEVKESWAKNGLRPTPVSQLAFERARVEQDALAAPSESEGRGEAFVGRELELERLGELLERATLGSGRVVFVTGELGIGKTALAEEFLRRVRATHPELVVATGRCLDQYGTGEAYLPFLDALAGLFSGPWRERIASVLRASAPTWCLQFPSVFGSGETLEMKRETIGATKQRMLREMRDGLVVLSADSPSVLLLEDLHWADPSSIDLIRLLCQCIDRQRLLVIGTFRPDDLEVRDHPLKNCKREMEAHRQCEEINLGMLSQKHVAVFLDARFIPNEFPSGLAELIQRKTEGHPLFATSLVHYLLERHHIARIKERWGLTRALSEMNLEVPESVRSMIRKKVDALDPEDRRALQYASIEGEEFNSSVLAALLAADELEIEERLARLEKVHRLIHTLGEEELPDGTLSTRYRFAHVLYQNVLYEDLLPKRRVLLHHRAGEELARQYADQAPRIAAQLAMHFERGRDFGRAVEYLTHAGDNATRLYAHAEAEERYSLALRLVDRLSPEERPPQCLTLYHKRGLVRFATSQFDQALGDFTKMLDQARAIQAPSLEGAALNALSHVLHFTHRLDEMGVRVSEALRVTEASGNEALRAETFTFVARRHVALGSLVEGKPLLDESIRIGTTLDHKPALIAGLAWRGHLHYFQSEYESAERSLARALDLSLELRDSFMLFFCLFFLGLTRANLGRISEALATFNEINQMARRNGERYQVLKITNCIGWIHRELGDLEGAFEHNLAGVAIAQKHQVLEAEVNSVINLGYDYICKADAEKTGRVFAEAEALLQRDDWLRWRFNLRLQSAKCESLLSQGDFVNAEGCARQLLESATHYEARKYVAIARKIRAELAVARRDLATAEAELNSALNLLQKYPAPLAAWKIHSGLGRLRLRGGNPSSAREAFDEAVRIIRMIAANVDDQTLRSTFLESPAVRDVLRHSSFQLDK
jgi:DNA-binding winged helix-turn-helix (wHTH) protein/tetratricopeptide (TPR) repeat protein